MKRVSLLGVDFDNYALEEVVEMLLARPAGVPFAYVVTPNADHITRLRRMPELAAVYRAAWLCVLDSRFISRLAGWLRLPRPAVVTGTDLTMHLLARLGGETVAVIGLAAGDFVALQARYPAISFLHHWPPMGLLHDPAAFAKAVDFGCASSAKFTFIGLGAPLQELLAHAIAKQNGRGTGLCIGAALQFCTASGRRAPPWMRDAGLEWLHRLVHDPRRLAGRYLVDDPPVLVALLGTAMKRWWKR